MRLLIRSIPSRARYVPAVASIACFGFVTALHGALAPMAMQVASLNLPLTAPGRLALDATNRLYIADPQARTVVVADAFGRLVSTRTGMGVPLGIAVDAMGVIYLGDQTSGSVRVYDSLWALQFQLGQGGGEFQLPNHIAVAADRTVWVSDSLAHQVKAYQAGVRIFTLGGFGTGPGQFNFPTGIGISAQGEVFVVDQNNDRVQVFSAAGAFLRQFPLQTPNLRGRSGRSQGVAIDSQSRVYVVDNFQGLIRVYDSQGSFLRPIASYGYSLGQLNLPVGAVIDNQNRLFVASAGNKRVDVYGLDCFTQLTASPSKQTVAPGTTASFSVIPSCADAYTYQWFRGTNALANSGNISGAASATLTLANLSVTDSDVYSVAVAGTNGVFTSPPLYLNVMIGAFILGDAAGDPADGTSTPPLNLASNSAILRLIPRPDGDLVLSWEDPAYVLEAAESCTGPWQKVHGGLSPYIVPQAAIEQSPNQYFRLRRTVTGGAPLKGTAGSQVLSPETPAL